MTTRTAVAEVEEPKLLTIMDCIEYIGGVGATVTSFGEWAQRRGFRLGQAWFMCLDADDQEKLAGGLYDPYFEDSWQPVIVALRYLLEN